MRCGWPERRPSSILCRCTSLELVARRSGGNPQFLRDLRAPRSYPEVIGSAGFRGSRGDGAHRRAHAGRPDARSPGGRVRTDVPSPDAGVARRRRRSVDPGRGHLVAAATDLRRGAGRLSAVSPFAAPRRGVRGTALQATAAPARGDRRPDRTGDPNRRKSKPTSCRCTTSKRANTIRRGDTRRSPGDMRTRSTPTSKRPASFRARSTPDVACPRPGPGA